MTKPKYVKCYVTAIAAWLVALCLSIGAVAILTPMDAVKFKTTMTGLSVVGLVGTLIIAINGNRRAAIQTGAISIIVISGTVMLAYVVDRQTFFSFPSPEHVTMAFITAVSVFVLAWCVLGLLHLKGKAE